MRANAFVSLAHTFVVCVFFSSTKLKSSAYFRNFFSFFALVRFVLRQHKLVYSMVYNVYACLLVIIKERTNSTEEEKKTTTSAPIERRCTNGGKNGTKYEQTMFLCLFARIILAVMTQWTVPFHDVWFFSVEYLYMCVYVYVYSPIPLLNLFVWWKKKSFLVFCSLLPPFYLSFLLPLLVGHSLFILYVI